MTVRLPFYGDLNELAEEIENGLYPDEVLHLARILIGADGTDPSLAKRFVRQVLQRFHDSGDEWKSCLPSSE